MKKTIIILFTFFCILSKASTLSDSLRISLLTVSPGTELYSTFGHTAIRVIDLKNNHDLVFNYGTFDFRTPNFYLKFALGLLDYQLSIERFEDFKSMCFYENRSVIEQVLNLNYSQRLTLISLLLENYKPENRKYRYKFFTDNCSTRPRDVISQTLGDSLILARTKVNANKSFRKLFTSYLTDMPWSRFGIELLLGKMTDQPAGYDALFLPDNLKVAIDKAYINDQPLEKSESILLETSPAKGSNNWLSPILASIILIVVSLLIQLKINWTGWYDSVFLFFLGFLGIFITVLSFASHHNELQSNFVILFFFPGIILIPFLKGKKRKRIAFLSFIIIASAFLCIPFLPQTFNIAVLLMSIAVAIRCFFNFAAILKKDQQA